MKVMAFNARPDERAFFDHFSQSLDMDLTLQKDTLTLDNVALTAATTAFLRATCLRRFGKRLRTVSFCGLLFIATIM
ncbi:MAG: hypothetical protein ACLUI6_11015 [Butyricicoccus sp.]